MKILYKNNIYTYDQQAIEFTVDLGQTSVGIPIASRLWLTDTVSDEVKAIAMWEDDGSENIIVAKLADDDCLHDHANDIIHGTRIIDMLSDDGDTMEIARDLVLAPASGPESSKSSILQPVNIMLTTSIDDIGTTHQRTLIIYGENSTAVFARITFIGETISEDMDIAAQAELHGLHISPDDNFVFYEADPNEPVYSSELLNRKRKEYLLCIDRLKDKIGTTDGLIDVIKYFGYDDMYIGTLWKISNTDSPYYKGYAIRYTDADGNSNTLDDHDIHYKQVNRAILVYKIVKTVDSPFEKVPYTAEANSYGVDGNSVKLARLRDVMNEQFMPAAIPIREILGECDVYYVAKFLHRAWDNLTEYSYSEHNIRLSIAKEDIYEFRLSRYYALASKIFSEDFIEQVARAEKDCLPNTYNECILSRLKRIHTIYEFLKDKKEFDRPNIVVWRGDGGVYLQCASSRVSIEVLQPNKHPQYRLRFDGAYNKTWFNINTTKIEPPKGYDHAYNRYLYGCYLKADGMTLDNFGEYFKITGSTFRDTWAVYGTPDIEVSYFVYLLTTPKVEGESNFIADTYSGIHSEAITIMMYLYEECEYLTDKLHDDAKEFPDYLWTVWQETTETISEPTQRETPGDAYDLSNLWDDTFTNRYCGCINVSLSCQDAFRYRWNDIHSWWDRTYRTNNGEKKIYWKEWKNSNSVFRDGMTWVNFASITKIEWTITKHDDPNIKYSYTCEKSDPHESIPHEDADGVADYDIYGVPVTASIYVYHHGEYDIEAIIYDNFGHIDRLYREKAVTVHPSKCYLMGIAQNVIPDAVPPIEDTLDAERGENAINNFCNQFLYGPMRYNRTFSNANGLVFKLPYFPKIVTKDTFYYMYPFTIANAVDANERYKYTDKRDVEGSQPFALPNLIPSQPTALILPLKNTNGNKTLDEFKQSSEKYLENIDRTYTYVESLSTESIKMWNSGETAAANTIVIVKGTSLYVYRMTPESQNPSEYDLQKTLDDLNSLPFFSKYRWQATYMPWDKNSLIAPTPILMGIAREITSDTDVDEIYLCNDAYVEYIDIVKESSPNEYDISYVANTYNFTVSDGTAEVKLDNMTYPSVISWIKDRYANSEDYPMYYISKAELVSKRKEKEVPKTPGQMFDAFIGMPHYGNWTFIAGGYAKLKKFSWVVLSIDNNNIPGKHNIVWDIEYRSVLSDPTSLSTAVGVVWKSDLSDESFELINSVSRSDYKSGVYNKSNFPSAYFPYMLSKIGQYRISCTFMDINGDLYKIPHAIIEVE